MKQAAAPAPAEKTPENPKTIFLAVDKLKPLPRNPRRITDYRFGLLCESIKANPDYFFDRPCLVNDASGELVIYAGNMRYHAAIKLGWKEVPCIVRTLTLEQQRERTIRDNVELGEWDSDELAADWEEAELKEWGVPDFVFDSGAFDVEEVPNFKEGVNFLIQCGSLDELADLKKVLGVGGQKIAYKSFKEILSASAAKQ